eukprot:CAMPEP_0170861954 /NCGR_PEP_ID=MMETSP0734-20130129/18620_1 /TAXON_ID=186038 /ORGANISM="Fragilariopsis kerguelensis, Strain L26-C5" /LENGTH=79 /DNA_ID=CAMNT_0011236331 /DNA_START=24 /DNA_END=263 /DNA_ORIENTATION=-
MTTSSGGVPDAIIFPSASVVSKVQNGGEVNGFAAVRVQIALMLGNERPLPVVRAFAMETSPWVGGPPEESVSMRMASPL